MGRTKEQGVKPRHWSRRTLTTFGAFSLASGILLGLVVLPASAVDICGSSNGISMCVSAPDGQLSGDEPIAVTVNGPVSDIKEMIFQWGPSTSSTAQLLTDYEYPYGFTWRTNQYLDATQFLNVRVKRLDDSVGGPVSLQLTLENGNDTSIPQNPNDWEQLFQPRSFTGDPVIAAVGDGGDGTVRSNEVADSILGSQAALLLYLGDLAYERGTPAELDANFGRSAFEPGGGAGWGKLSRFTRPTLGNHEVVNLAAWRNYWHGRPDWESFVFGGVRFLNLNSECATVGGCGPQSAQYAFVQSVLSTNSQECVVAYWHRPVLSAVEDNAEMQPIWSLLAAGGGDLVLNGHTHDMEAYGSARRVPASRRPGCPYGRAGIGRRWPLPHRGGGHRSERRLAGHQGPGRRLCHGRRRRDGICDTAELGLPRPERWARRAEREGKARDRSSARTSPTRPPRSSPTTSRRGTSRVGAE